MISLGATGSVDTHSLGDSDSDSSSQLYDHPQSQKMIQEKKEDISQHHPSPPPKSDSELPTYGELIGSQGPGPSRATTSAPISPVQPTPNVRPLVVSPSALPARCTNHVSYHVRRSEGIKGTYRINPQLCVPGSSTHPDHHRHASRAKSKKIKIGSGKHAIPADKEHSEPTACFSTKRGDIKIDASIVSATSPASEQPPVDRRLQTKATVEVRTKSGDIELNLREIESGLQASLDLQSRTGDVVLFVPKSFRGPMHITSKKNRATITFLPSLSQHIRVIRTTKHEALIMMGDSSGPAQAPSAILPDTAGMIQHWDGDYAQIDSRSGNIIIGISGEDKKNASMSFWQKMSMLPNVVKEAYSGKRPTSWQPKAAASDAVSPSK
ncbi:hypothetical protein FRC02_006258 [Tulasnella sp. 418]|nr:hypothetical protein FRC02_006258 [Tulasnella sp. 418]